MTQTHHSGAGRARRWFGKRTRMAPRPTRGRRRPCLEPLESRFLLATTITEFSAPSNGTIVGTNVVQPQITTGPDGNLWFTEPAANEIGAFDPANDTVSHQVLTRVTGGDPPGITATTGPNGAIWFSLSAVGQVGMITPSPSPSAVIDAQFGVPYSSTAGITFIGNDPWFMMPSANQIGMYDPITKITTYSLSPANINGFSSQVTVGSDGNLWFTEPGAIGIFSPNSKSVIAQVSLPTSGGTQMPTAITHGPDGNIWFTESVPNSGKTGFVSSSVGVINTTTQKYITEFSTPASSQPSGITSGPDGNIWFTESAAGAIGIVNVNSVSDPTQDKLGSPIPIPTLGQTGGVVSSPDPQGITTGPAGNNVWFVDGAGAIGEVVVPATHLVVTPLGTVTAGSGFDVTVTDKYVSGPVDTAFNGTVTITLSGGAPGLAGQFQRQPRGQHHRPRG